MDSKYIKLIAQWIGIKEIQVTHKIELMNEGATIPFISKNRRSGLGCL